MSTLSELFFTFAKVGAFTFGGGYAMIPILDSECVEKKQWITSDEFMELTVIAESTPGPIAINCATYTGYKRAGIPGAIAATVGMVLPSFFIILIISAFFERLLNYPVVENAFKGIRIGVALLIVRAGIKMVKRELKGSTHKTVSIAFAAVFFAVALVINILGISFSTIYLMIIAGMVGFCLFALPKGRDEK
ncbi:MAG: chromate transporter [Clostridiales bacterium]|nr:chromate transporter [Clostridiales bacterium]